jgi:hypothetical protein
MIIEMTTGIEIIGGGVVVGVGVEKDLVVTGTEKGIIAIIVGVPATILMITGSVGETGIHTNINFIVKFCWFTQIHAFFCDEQFVSCT